MKFILLLLPLLLLTTQVVAENDVQMQFIPVTLECTKVVNSREDFSSLTSYLSNKYKELPIFTSKKTAIEDSLVSQISQLFIVVNPITNRYHAIVDNEVFVKESKLLYFTSCILTAGDYDNDILNSNKDTLETLLELDKKFFDVKEYQEKQEMEN